MRKKFPIAFPVDLLPDGAKEEHIVVYRICRTGSVEPASFRPTYLDELAKTKENEGELEIGQFSLSTYEKPRDARQKLKFFRGRNPAAIVARGVTESCCGLTQRTRERTGTKSSHVDWWLYEGAQPHKYFHKIEPEDLRKEG